LDISLENIVLDEKWTPKICDFGVARFGKPTRPGKQKYMALEIFQGHKFSGFSADLYSLGIVLFCITFGFHPYSSADSNNPNFLLAQKGNVKMLIDSLPESHQRSQELKDLICKLVTPLENRINMEALWEHPWLCV
jgi:serine/threonine protein kinase